MDKDKQFLIERVQYFLENEFNIPIEQTEHSVLEFLIRIEKFLFYFETARTNLVNDVKKFSKLNLLKISTETGISRTSIYSNQVILKYCKLRVNQIQNANILEKKERIEMTIISKLQQKIVDTYELENEINSKKNEIEDLRRIIGIQKNEIAQLKSENSSLKRKVSNSKLIRLLRENGSN
ncbi:hypothetical protein [Streptococcus uberis]|uniref:hypothetical protein n=1 Tax=Streptococcus uberis TaxID=1349 RepID=UPI000E00FEB0|nr:hypothetical protein [Streptococcus uberis]SUO88973.1 Uncharacterised protein [Streptococcus uberis]